MPLDLVPVPGCKLHVGEDLVSVQEIWRSHSDLGLPWHYFAKQTGALEIEINSLRVQRSPITWAELNIVSPELVSRLREGTSTWDEPADLLSWEEATTSAALLAQHHGEALRLPTEFEWERIARGDHDRIYPWGDTFDPTCANLTEAGVGHIEAVGLRQNGASQHGVLDLIGNIDE